MKYAIVLWNSDNLSYDIIHYTTDFDDAERMMIKYPRSRGYIHLIEVMHIKAHEINLIFDAEKKRKLENQNATTTDS